jgi:hypothetical protein
MNPVALERAEKGLAWLRESGPIYGLNVDLVDLSYLQLSCSCNCVLGQLDQDYTVVIARLADAGLFETRLEADHWAKEHGFNDDWAEQVFYSDLNEAWKQLLTADRT